MKSSCRCLKGSEGGGLRPLGIKTVVFRITDLRSQTLLVDGFCYFVEVFPQMPTHSLNHLQCTTENEGMQKPKRGDYQGAGKNQVAVLGSHTLTVHLIYSHCLPTLISLTQEQTVSMLWQRCDHGGSFLQKQNRLFRICHNLHRSCCCLCRKASDILKFLSKDSVSTNLLRLFFFFNI